MTFITVRFQERCLRSVFKRSSISLALTGLFVLGPSVFGGVLGESSASWSLAAQAQESSQSQGAKGEVDVPATPPPFSNPKKKEMSDPVAPPAKPGAVLPTKRPSQADEGTAPDAGIKSETGADMDEPEALPMPDSEKEEASQETSALSCAVANARMEVMVEPIEGENGCGVPKPVVLKEAGSADLNGDPTLDCAFSKDVATWVDEDVQRIAEAVTGESVAKLVTGPGYQCRRRNNQKTGKLSEHAMGKALDISAFVLASGKVISVERDWNEETASDADASKFLKQVHASACKRFTTVLGPDADANHKAHFHLDIGCHGQSCTYLICQ